MAASLSLPHKPQQGDGYCLPACVQMVLAYFGVTRSQEVIGKTLGLNPPFGTRHSNIQKLASSTLLVTYEAGDLPDIRNWLDQDVPVIAFVQAGELPHWSGYHFQHAFAIFRYDPAHPDEGEWKVRREIHLLES